LGDVRVTYAGERGTMMNGRLLGGGIIEDLWLEEEERRWASRGGGRLWGGKGKL